MRQAVGSLVAVLMLLAPGLACAHDSFIVAPATAVAGQPLLVQVTSSSFFPEPETPIRPNRIDRVVARSGDASLYASPVAGDVAMQLTLSAPGPEGAVIGVSLTPWEIAIGADEAPHYMDEIGALPSLRTAVIAATTGASMQETYTKHLKTIVCGADCAMAGAERPLGLQMEFVADAADSRSFILLKDGAPLAGLPVFATTEAKGLVPLVTDAAGRIVLPDGLSGPILLMAVDLQPPTPSGGRFQSQWAALTFDARLLGR
jgi:hypothetical protein